MAEKTVTVQNKDTLMEVSRREKDPEVKRKLSFISLVAQPGAEFNAWPVMITRCSNNYGPFQFPKKRITKTKI
ncbi:hypothetical protein M1N87_02465 [Dehalococcoidia bacterium]|nr:hypothetical protein [Dehalococcoidia bacterium]